MEDDLDWGTEYPSTCAARRLQKTNTLSDGR
jgi:hypothetical protein